MLYRNTVRGSIQGFRSTATINVEPNDEASNDAEETFNEELSQTCSTLYNKMVESVRENKRLIQLLSELKQEKDDMLEKTVSSI